MATTIQVKRGAAAGIPTLASGEPGWTTDTNKLYIGTGAGNVLIGPGASGALADGDYGDVTVSSSGTAIAIDAGAVTFAKMQAVSANVLLGNDASGTTVEEIACTAAGRDLLDDANAAAQRATLGGTTAGQAFFTVTNPGAITFPRVNADNSLSLLSDSAFRTAIGAGTGSGSGTVTSVATGSGLTGGTITSTGTISLDINGTTALTTPLNDDAAIIYDDSAAANRKVLLRYLIALFGTYITPIGSVLPFAGSSIPSSFLECDGSAVSRTTYADLFTAIGTTWGSGDGSTTFNVPDFRGRTLIGVGTGSGLTARTLGTTGGAETVTLAASEIPAHKHQVKSPNGSTMYKTGGGAANNVLSVASVAIGGTYETEDNTGGGGAHANMQPWAAVKWMIRYA